ncbi:phage capsid protein [Paenibacillus odorifer]|uniref:Phage capsid protein n=1 Tax=Paenibacillus odorifer TaxID=189426 RepID=A0A1R0X062_9BACL|nr:MULTISPECIES: major capsid protein [Paenibacillus]ETT55195.1 phage protein [Paenibacillus sp. FSL H8-237]OMD25466.1 phage capsid protein [Paenibacillus odorifer]OME46920.1 phage capsid protein [Paenibacillus odorifer]
MATIFDIVRAPEIAAYYAANPSNAIPYLGATLFPAAKKLGLDLSWIKGAGGLPVALMPSEFDAKATVRDRIGFGKVETEMPFFREAMTIKEKERQELLRLLESQNSAYVQSLIKQIYDDRTNLINGAEVNAERMRMQLMSSGKIRITANRVDYDYDFKMKSGHKTTFTGSDKWDDPTANIVSDIKEMQDTIEDEQGVRPTKMILTRKTWNSIMANEKIRLDMNPLGGQNIIMTDSLMRQYLEAKLGVTIAVYNKKYALQDGSAHQFYPDDYITLIPDGTLGKTWYGTTPEEADLMSGATSAEVSIVNTGVAVTTVKQSHSVQVETIVSAITMPSFESLDNIFIAKVV